MNDDDRQARHKAESEQVRKSAGRFLTAGIVCFALAAGAFYYLDWQRSKGQKIDSHPLFYVMLFFGLHGFILLFITKMMFRANDASRPEIDHRKDPPPRK